MGKTKNNTQIAITWKWHGCHFKKYFVGCGTCGCARHLPAFHFGPPKLQFLHRETGLVVIHLKFKLGGQLSEQ